MHNALRRLPLVLAFAIVACIPVACFTDDSASRGPGSAAADPLALVAAASLEGRLPRGGMQTGFHPFAVEATRSNGDLVQGMASVWVPPDYSASDRDYPLVVFLHGYGERGDDGVKQTTQGLGKLLSATPERFVGCLVLLPQCPDDAVWSRNDQPWARGKPDAEALVDASLQCVLRDYAVDPNRISLTGLSMGGFATFQYGARRADWFSALVPLCGGGDLADAKALARRPMWVIHGAADRTVPVEESRRMVEAIRGHGGSMVYSVYAGVGHNCWDRGYGDPDVWSFLVDHERPGR